MAGLREGILKEVARLRAEMQKVDRVIAPQLRKKRRYEEQIQPLLTYLKTIGESTDEETEATPSSVIHKRTANGKRPLKHVGYETIKRIGHKIHLKELIAEIEKDGTYKIPGKNPTRNLQTVFWRDKRVIFYGKGIYGLAEWP